MIVEPKRPLAEEGTALERTLLESARADAIPAASLERLARALSVASAGPGGPGAEPSRLVQQSTLPKLGAWGLVGATGVTAALLWLAAAPSTSEPSSAAALEAPAALVTKALAPPLFEAHHAHAKPSVAAVAPPADVARSAPVTPSLPVTRAEPAERGTSLRHRPGARSRRPAPAEAASDGHDARGLRAELSAVEAVQLALRAGQVNDAERRLADYSRRFPRGELALESELLRIDLDAAKGDHERARAQARQLLARPEAARYRARLEAIARHGAD